ncbi:MAG: helix-hairpin-helix domain-containing protein [Cyanobacteria bacterium J06627_15]
MIRTALSTPLSTQCAAFSNDDIADILGQVADLLEIQQDDYYRIRAYREGAEAIRGTSRPVAEIWQSGGVKELERLPRIGQGIARSLEELFQTGELSLLNRLRLEVSPDDLFTTIPGIGQVLAHRIHQDLGIETLEELELAAHTGRLDRVKGFGHGRTQLVRDTLESILNRSSRQHVRLSHWREMGKAVNPPSPNLILDIDKQYRQLATAGQLRTIAPKRFNPEHKSWLPILHKQQGGWQFSALYSNTARAHDLGKTHDWVVIYYEREDYQGQCTVVTETRGSQRGQRTIRGLQMPNKTSAN